MFSVCLILLCKVLLPDFSTLIGYLLVKYVIMEHTSTLYSPPETHLLRMVSERNFLASSYTQLVNKNTNVSIDRQTGANNELTFNDLTWETGF